MLYEELELRLRGERPSATDPAWKEPPPSPSISPDGTPAFHPTDVGVCFHTLLFNHDPETVEDDHGLCLCHLTTCLPCFSSNAKGRKGAYSLLPYELANTDASKGWSGGIESKAQADARRASLAPRSSTSVSIPEGRGFVKNPKSAKPPTTSRPPPLFPHPQMTDVLAVEEHLRWRLKEMGASDPAVEARYGPCTYSPAATEGVNLPPPEPEFSIGESPTPITPRGNKVVVNTRGIRRKIPPSKAVTPKSTIVAKKQKEQEKEKEKGKQCLLPKTWMDADPQERNMAIILTFRHFVKVSQPIKRQTFRREPDSDIYDSYYTRPPSRYHHSRTPPTLPILNTSKASILSHCTDDFPSRVNYVKHNIHPTCELGWIVWINGAKNLLRKREQE